MSKPPKLSDLIEFSQEDIERAINEQAKDESAVAQAATHIAGFAAGIAATQLNTALDIDVLELLGKAWSKVKNVRDAAAKSRDTPGEAVIINLGSHDFTHSCQPVMSVRVGTVPLPELKLTLELVAAFKSVRLSITDGKLVSLAPGEASATVRLKYKSMKLKETSTPTWKLPGSVALGLIPIA
jgi:hypothetical protein